MWVYEGDDGECNKEGTVYDRQFFEQRRKRKGNRRDNV